MRSRKNLALLLAALTACATVPTPVDPVALSPGQRVRVTLASRVAPAPLQGTLLFASPDSLVVRREEGGERRFSRTQVERVEVSVARTSEPEKAAGYGILAGAPLLIPLIILAPIVAYEAGKETMMIILVPVAALAAVGAAIGSGEQDVWVEASWPRLEAVVPTDSIGAENE